MSSVLWRLLVWLVGPLILLWLGIVIILTPQWNCEFFCFSPYFFPFLWAVFLWALVAVFQIWQLFGPYRDLSLSQKIIRLIVVIIVAICSIFPVLSIVGTVANKLTSAYAAMTRPSISIVSPAAGVTLVNGESFRLEWLAKNISPDAQLTVFLQDYYVDKKGNKQYGGAYSNTQIGTVLNAQQSASFIMHAPGRPVYPDKDLRYRLTIDFDRSYGPDPLGHDWYRAEASIPIELKNPAQYKPY